MKAIFPGKGVIIVTKYNVNVLKDFYKNNLINSKLFGIYEQSNYYLQVGNFNYFPKKSNLVLEDAHLLTLKQLQELIAKQMKENPNSLKDKSSSDNKIKISDNTKDFSDKPLDDNFVKNNPFFSTLTSI